MTVWIVLLLLLVALSPLTWLLPSRSQRGQMTLRLQARHLGLAMQLSHEQWPYWLQCSPPRACPQYHRARTRGRRDVWAYWQSEPGVWLNKWQEPCADERLAAQLLTLPSDVYKAEATVQMVALCWNEHGNAESLQAVSAFLRAHA
jgi:hypothetical protein